MTGWGLFLALVATVSVVTVVRSSPFTGYYRVISPLSIGSIVLYTIFAVRPLVASPKDYDFYGINVADGALVAQAAGTGTLLFMAIGSRLGAARRLRSTEPHSRELDNSTYSRIARTSAAPIALLLTAFFAVAFLALLTAKGGSAAVYSILFAGRSRAAAASLGGLPTIVAMMPMMGAAAVTVVILFRGRRKFSKTDIACLLSCLILSFALVVGTGNRRSLIPIVLAPAAAWVYVNNPRVKLRIVAAGATGLAFFAILPFVRSAGARQGKGVFQASYEYVQDGGLSQIWDGYILSFDTEMLNYVSYLATRIGVTYPFGFGRATVGELLTFPLPGGYVENYSDIALTRIFGGGCGAPYCPVPSVVGVLVLDFGLVAGPIVVLLLAYLMRRFEVRAAQRKCSTRGLVMFISLSAYGPVLVRTYSPDALWWSIYLFFFMLIALTVLTSQRRLPRADGVDGADGTINVRAGRSERH